MCSRVTLKIKTIHQLSQQLDHMHLTDRARTWQHPHPDTGELFGGERIPVVISPYGRMIDVCQYGFSFGGGDLITNARAETISEKPAWAKLFARQRCVVPVTGFWEYSPQRKPFHFSMDSQATELFYLAGMYDGDRFAIITTTPSPLVAVVHSRMPVVLHQQDAAQWVNCDPNNGPLPLERLKLLLTPWNGELLRQQVTVKQAA